MMRLTDLSTSQRLLLLANVPLRVTIVKSWWAFIVCQERTLSFFVNSITIGSLINRLIIKSPEIFRSGWSKCALFEEVVFIHSVIPFTFSLSNKLITSAARIRCRWDFIRSFFAFFCKHRGERNHATNLENLLWWLRKKRNSLWSRCDGNNRWTVSSAGLSWCFTSELLYWRSYYIEDKTNLYILNSQISLWSIRNFSFGCNLTTSDCIHLAIIHVLTTHIEDKKLVSGKSCILPHLYYLLMFTHERAFLYIKGKFEEVLPSSVDWTSKCDNLNIYMNIIIQS